MKTKRIKQKVKIYEKNKIKIKFTNVVGGWKIKETENKIQLYTKNKSTDKWNYMLL